MIFYKCETPDGQVLAPTQADARAIDRDFTQVDVPTDKAGLMAFVNNLYEKLAGAAEQSSEPALVYEPLPVSTPPAPSYTAQSVSVDDAWAKLNITRKLHFAALAMEDAREYIKEEALG